MTSDHSEVKERLASERDRLSALAADLREGIAKESETASLEELSDSDQHAAELATETFNRERDLSTMESIEAELDDVDRALQRLEDGSYGTCVACGRPISPERLEALPATPYCIEDAELAEREAAPGVAPVGRPAVDNPQGRAI